MSAISKEIIRFCFDLEYKALPVHTVKMVKMALLDFLGVAIRGSLTDSAETVMKFVKNSAPKGRFPIIGSKYLTSPEYAALANGVAAHSIELDDIHKDASLHPGVVIFPAALAAAKLARSTGKDFIVAVVLGYEIMVRLGMSLGPEEHYAHGFHPTATCGVFGSTVAVAKLLGLDKKQMSYALGIAGSMTSGLREYHSEGAWTKRLHPGWAAHNGILASFLAREGFTGPLQVIEGKNGFLRSYSDSPQPEKICQRLGSSYAISSISFKLHACCRFKHASIDGILKMVKEHDLKPEEIKKIKLGILSVAFPAIVEPVEVKYNPRSVSVAQFSMPYGAAISILKRRASLEEYEEKYLDSEEVNNLMQRVECFRDPSLDAAFPTQWPATIQIETFDGKTLEIFVRHPKGDPESPLSWRELEEKFRQLSALLYSHQEQNKLIDRVKDLDELSDISKLYNLLIRRQR